MTRDLLSPEGQNHADQSRVDQRLSLAEALLVAEPARTETLWKPLAASGAFAAAALVLAVVMVIGPGWDETGTKSGITRRSAAATATEAPAPQVMVASETAP